MRTKSPRIHVITLGCAKNIYDSELLMGMLKKNQLDVVYDTDVSSNDIVIVNTCGFIKDAKQESINHILEYAELNRIGKIKGLYVVGCLSERYKNTLKKEISGVDAFYGLDYMKSLMNTFEIDYQEELVGERLLTTPSHYAYLKISDGCNHHCSFCAIPLIKGKYKSQTPENVIEQAKYLAGMGVKELIFIAQDTTYYGFDFCKKRILPDLIEKISQVDGIEWIRLQYAFPSKFPLELLDMIRDNPKICKYLDIPFQHISDNMLKIMQRGITKMQTLELIGKIKESVPGVALRTTIIVGHPGETDKDFQELMDFVEKTRFDRLGAFKYSNEEGTKSFKLKDTISKKEKDNRYSLLMKLQQKISLELNQLKVGKQYKTIIDDQKGDIFVGRTEFDSPEVDNEVHIKAEDLVIGNFYNVKITNALEYDLEGIIS